MITSSPSPRSSLDKVILPAFLLFLIWQDLRWLVVNVTPIGWDPPSHLLKTVAYHRILHPWTPQSFFSIFTWDPYRPPLFHLVAIPFYQIFGLSADVATASNAGWLALVVIGTYLLGRRLFRSSVGLWAALIVGLYPMCFSLSHYFYTEIALTATVAWAVWALVASEGFSRRRYSLLFGIFTGAGLLVKWTFVAYLIGPLFIEIAHCVRAGHLAGISWRPTYRKMVNALGGGGVLVALWYGPNLSALTHLTLGYAILPISLLLWTLTLYMVQVSQSRCAQFAAAATLSFSMASLWYLVHPDFIHAFLAVAYRGQGTGPRHFAWYQIDTYTYYASKLYGEHLGPGFTLLLLAALAVWIAQRRSALWKDRAFLLLLSWSAGTYLVFTLATFRSSRVLLPMLPALALATVGGLTAIPQHTARRGMILLSLIFGLLQFVALNYDSRQDLRAWGHPLFASGQHLQLPATGPTDPGYWIAPDVLQAVDQAGSPQKLCLLINISQLNGRHFKYLARTRYPTIAVRDLAKVSREKTLNHELSTCDFVLFKNRFNVRVRPVGQKLIADILSGHELGFAAQFALRQRYILPNGNTAYLYQAKP